MARTRTISGLVFAAKWPAILCSPRFCSDLGMDELSVSASLVPRVKRAVQRLSVSECQQLVAEVMELETPDEILERCQALAQKHYPDLL